MDFDINSIIQLWDYLQKEGLSFLLTNRINQDCLENAFSSIRRAGGFRDNPDCKEFESAIRSVMSHNLLKSSKLTNCEEDDDDILTSVFYDSEKITHPVIPVANTENYLQNENTSNSSEFGEDFNNLEVFHNHSLIEKNVITYLSGYLAHKILKKFNSCNICKQLPYKCKFGRIYNVARV